MNSSWLYRDFTNRATDTKVVTWVARFLVLVTLTIGIPSLLFVLSVLVSDGWGLLVVGGPYLYCVAGAAICGLPVALIGLIYLELLSRTGFGWHLVVGAIAGLCSAGMALLLAALSAGAPPSHTLDPTFYSFYLGVAVGGIVLGLLTASIYYVSTRLIETGWTRLRG